MRWVSFLLGMVAAASLSWGDVVRLKDGRSLEGTVVEQTDRAVRLRMRGGGEVVLPRSRVVAIERGESPTAAYARRAAELKDDDAAGHFALAEYCTEKHLIIQAMAEYRIALRAQRDHPQALARLRKLIDPRARRLIRNAIDLQD